MPKRNNEYWTSRFEALNETLLNRGEKFNIKMTSAYEEASRNIQKEIEAFYGRFATNNAITLSEAKRVLDSDERKAFQMELKEYIKKGKENGLNEKWVRELENASNVYRIDRLKALQLQMRQQVEQLENTKAAGLTQTAKDIYQEGFYKTAYEVQKGQGIGTPFARLDTKRIEKVLAASWSPDGKNFSEKIWGEDRQKLVFQLETKLTQSIIRGEGPDKVMKEISKIMNVSKSAASRLIMTESAFFASAAQRDSYEELGLEQYQILSTLDSTTCDICGNLETDPISMKEYQPGVTAPPFHPNCRCTTIPYYEDEFGEGKRVARGEDGKTELLSDKISFQEWKEKYTSSDESSKRKEGFVPAQSIQEAEQYAREELGIPLVNYNGCDPAAANAWNEGLRDTFERFPEIREQFGFVGECHERNNLLEPVVRRYYKEKWLATYPQFTEEELRPRINKSVDRYMSAIAIPEDCYAQSWNPVTEEYSAFRGITINRDIGKDYEKLLEYLKRDVDLKFHPVGCDTIRSILDHEIGHQLDHWLNISEEKNIKSLFDSRTKEQIREDLCEYAWNNKSKDRYAEFIAEGWTEYCNNPNPRAVAKEIGETIERMYEEWKKNHP